LLSAGGLYASLHQLQMLGNWYMTSGWRGWRRMLILPNIKARWPVPTSWLQQF
jgi:hypothetical protein